MQYKVYALPVTGDPELEEEFNHFLRSCRVISVQKSLEMVGGTPHWCFCVEFMLSASQQGLAIRSAEKIKPRVDYRELLSPEEFTLYAQIRDWRKEQAEKDGIPVYSVVTNAQMADVAVKRPQTMADLQKIDGIGEGKSSRYGADLLTFAKLETS
jgi:superfamily II DNA helicase RecQ